MTETEAICNACYFPDPTMMELRGATPDPDLERPVDFEDALTKGWVEYELGLLCPACAKPYLEQLRQDQETGVQTNSDLVAFAEALEQETEPE